MSSPTGKKMRILLTGSSGYIGTSLRKQFGKRFLFIPYDIKDSPKNTVFDFDQLKKKIKNVDGILHLAAISRPKWGFEDPYKCLTTNIVGTLNILEAVREVNPTAWVIFGSSREVFGGLSRFPAKETSPRLPLNAYAVSKVCGEDLLREYARNYGLRCLAIRFSGVYTGKNDILDRVVPRFILQALRGAPIIVEGDGKKKFFDFVYIDDALRGIERAMRHIARKKKGFYEDITLAAHNPVSLEDLALKIIGLTKSKSKIIRVKERSYDVKGFWGTYDKAQKILGWKPQIELMTGLKRSIEELKQLGTGSGYKRR